MILIYICANGLMMKKYDDNTVRVFFRLLRAGLWGRLEDFGAETAGSGFAGNAAANLDGCSAAEGKATNSLGAGSAGWKQLYRLAMEQTVAGYVAVGLSGKSVSAVPENVMQAFNKVKFSTGLWNYQMNDFLAKLIKDLNEAGIEPLLLKGQGVARNYIYPELRQPGDIDLLLHGEDYYKAKRHLEPKADKLEAEGSSNKHLGLHFGNIEVELHGTVHGNFGKKFNSYLDNCQEELFIYKNFRHWRYNEVEIPVPSADFDALFIFTHFLNHFYFGGLGLRQICDWAMHLHKNSEQIDRAKLEKDISKLGLLREWQTFGCFAVKYLGLPEREMPMYSDRYYRNCDKIMHFLFVSGNFGHHRGRKDYSHNPYLIRKAKSLFIKGGDIISLFSVFPGNTIRFLFVFLKNGFGVAAKGE